MSGTNSTTETIKSDALGVFPAKLCSLCGKHQSRHYCIHPDPNGREVFHCSSNLYPGTAIQKRCGHCFCHACKEAYNYESTTLCPFHHPDSNVKTPATPTTVTQTQDTQQLSQLSQGSALSQESTQTATSIFDKTPRDNSMPEELPTKQLKAKKRKKIIIDNFKNKRITVGGRVSVKRGKLFHVLYDEKEKQQYISSEVANDYDYYGEVVKRVGSRKYEIKFDILPDTNNNRVVMDRGNIQVIDPNFEKQLRDINEECKFEGMLEREPTPKPANSTNKKSVKQQAIDSFLSAGPDVIKNAKTYIHSEGTESNKTSIEWEILGMGENIVEDSFEYPKPPELNFDDVDLSDPGTHSSFLHNSPKLHAPILHSHQPNSFIHSYSLQGILR